MLNKKTLLKATVSLGVFTSLYGGFLYYQSENDTFKHVEAETPKTFVYYDEQAEANLLLEMKRLERLADSKVTAKEEVNAYNLSQLDKDKFNNAIEKATSVYEVRSIVHEAEELSNKNDEDEKTQAESLVIKLEQEQNDTNLKAAKDYVNTLHNKNNKKSFDKRISNVENAITQKKAEEERLKQEAEKQSAQNSGGVTSTEVVGEEPVEFGSDGLLIMEASSLGQEVVNRLLAIPNHRNGSSYHSEIDPLINQLTTRQALWVLWRIEGAGFGQTGSGMAGIDTPESHQTLVTVQLNGRFGGSIHTLLARWGTFSYGGY